jgi:hypothetical protein
MTKILIECSGGMLDRNRDLTVDLENMPDSEARTLLHLIREANFFNIPSNLIQHPAPEKLQYKITVDAGIVFHTVRGNENTTPEALRPLLNELSARLGAQLV